MKTVSGVKQVPKLWILIVATALVAAAGVRPASSQIPDKFKNLKVLPRDISKQDLLDTMRRFTGSLGVRCSHCHAGEEGKPLSTYDFASDEKNEKVVARDMMRMVRDINAKYLAAIDFKESDEPAKESDKPAVACVTCHHGLAKPHELEDVLIAVDEKKGLDASIQTYQDLKKRYYGGNQYDFGVGPLSVLSDHLAKSGKMDDAIKAAQMNVQFHPGEPFALIVLGDAYAKAGNKDKAIETLKKVLEMEPGNGWAKRRLEMLQDEGKPAEKPK